MAFNFDINQMPFIGNFFDDKGHNQNQRTWNAMAQNYQAYRPEAAQARLNALNSQMSMFAPVNAALGQMYGNGAQFNMDQALNNPLTNRMMDMGAPKGAQLLNPQANAAQQAQAERNGRAIMGNSKWEQAHPESTRPQNPQLGGQRQAMYAPGKVK